MEAAEEETVHSAKQRLEPNCDVPAAQQRWLVKGKEAMDEHTVGSLGASKVMVLRNHTAHTAKGAASSAAPAPAGAPAAAQISASESTSPHLPEATELGDGLTLLMVSNGRQQLRLHCHGSSTILNIKELLHASCGAAPRQQRLLVKGKEAEDASTVDSLGLVGGGKLMLLFREGQHRLIEGDAVLRTCTSTIADLTKRIAEAEARGRKRLDEPMVVLMAIGALKDEVRAVRLDVQNSKVSQPSERAVLLREVDKLNERLEKLREQVK
jgi:hypothetical protein